MKQREQLGLSFVFFVLGLICSFCLACAQSGKQEGPPSTVWQNHMQELGQNLVELYPYLVSPERFNAPENRSNIQKHVEKMGQLTHGVKLERENKDLGHKLDKDPYMAVILNVLDRETEQAIKGLRAGKRDFARVVLKNSTSMCIRCHSRGQWGPEFVDWDKQKTFQSLSPIEKGDLLAAVRQYDPAIQQYEVVLSDKKLAASEAESWVRAGKAALNVAVRAKQDPVAAQRIVSTILSNPSLPEFLKRDAEDWQKAVGDWQKTREAEEKSAAAGRVNRLQMAERVLEQARKSEDYWGDRSSYIQYLRASALLHDFLRTEASVQDQARALFLLGRSYEVISEMGDGDPNEFYYKACIKRSPHSKIAAQCYHRLEQNINFDSPDGMGIYLSPGVTIQQLQTWRSLATPVHVEPIDEGRSLFDRQ